SDPPVQLISLLGGSPDQQGSWWDENGNSYPDMFIPDTASTGTFIYVVPGAGGCGNDTAEVFIELFQAPNAGVGGAIAVCATDDAVNLFDALGGTPDPGGTWDDIDATGALTDSIFDATAVALGTYEFDYELPANGTCPPASATLLVTVGLGASAGVGGNDTVCGGVVHDLFGSLGGNPDLGGVWSDDLGTGSLNGSEVNAWELVPGATTPFTYTVTTPGCGDVSATVILVVTEYPDPGIGGPVVVCTGSSPIALFDQLGGSPDPGGEWYGPNAQLHGPTFDPLSDPGGSYTYLLPGTAPCNDTTAVLQLFIEEPPNAGADSSIVICTNAEDLYLFDALGGEPSLNGTWIDVDGTDALSMDTLLVDSLDMGTYEFQYLVSVIGCGTDTARVLVQVVDGVQIVGLSSVCNEQDRTYTVSFTIEGGDPASYSISGLNGSLSPSAPYVFLSEVLFTGQDFYAVVTDSNDCAGQIVEGVSPCDFEDDVFVPGAFTPDGDGINETLQVPGIESFPSNSLIIFNRWGDVVFEASGYDNRTIVWDGTSDKAAFSGPLPDGTYFYVLDLGDGSDARRGYIYLQR
ncbi:MAG: gliding motility-associated C-terminal domain-containing protein, partial [Flavobacteriales bacterium]|nr:gliding motility-associated C-terminal domain-containing protein [Flavobacteriales bacterium]